MDLAKLDATILSETGVEMTLRHPVDKSELDVKLVVRGTNSIKVKTALEKFVKISDDPKKSELEKERALHNVLVNAIVDIKNATYDDEPIKADPDGIKFFIQKFTWATNQVTEFISDIENFLPKDNS